MHFRTKRRDDAETSSRRGQHIIPQPHYTKTDNRVLTQRAKAISASSRLALNSRPLTNANSTLHRKLRIRAIRSSIKIGRNTLSEEAVTAIMDGKRVFGSAKNILEAINAERAYGLMDVLNPLGIDNLLHAH